MLVSVIIPSYNRSATIARAIQSVQEQTHRDLEIIVVDDGSKDDSRAILEGFSARDPRVRCIFHEKNRGAQAARNTGIHAARGEWIAFLDSDDYYYSHSLESRLRIIVREQVQVVHSECDVIRDDGVKKPLEVPPLRGDLYLELLKKPFTVFAGILVEKAALERIGFLDERVSAFQEWDTSIHLARYFHFGFEPRSTFAYDRRGKSSISKNKLLDAQGYEQVINNHKGEILRYLGPRGLRKHYLSLVSRYEAAHDEQNRSRCSRLATFWGQHIFHVVWRYASRIYLRKDRIHDHRTDRPG